MFNAKLQKYMKIYYHVKLAFNCIINFDIGSLLSFVAKKYFSFKKICAEKTSKEFLILFINFTLTNYIVISVVKYLQM